MHNLNPIIAKLTQRQQKTSSVLCVGLDSDISQLPAHFLKSATPQYDFNRWIIDQTHAFVSAYKPNTAFYEARGAQGWKELAQTITYLKTNHPDITIIADAKRADIGSTNQGYVRAFFDDLGCDAITLQPYLGKEALSPFLERTDKLNIILCHTSNPGAEELQGLHVSSQPLWEVVADAVAEKWNPQHNCALVVGATYPETIRHLRQKHPQLWFLVPGVGTQGGELHSVLEAGLMKNGLGIIVAVSRSVIFSPDPKNAASQLHQQIMHLLI